MKAPRVVVAVAAAVLGPWLGAGCNGTPPLDAGPCGYPDGAVEPMAEGAVIWPYRWSTALLADRTSKSLDLAAVHCRTDDDVEWSPFDVLLFISIPAW